MQFRILNFITIFWIKYPKKYTDFKTKETKVAVRRKPFEVVDDGMYAAFMKELKGE